jgi:RNA polymerase sigma-70 factor (ECF subfamily)
MVDDLIQETYMKLCAGKLRLLDNFKSRHEDAIYGYVKVFTANLVHDHFKASSARKRGGLAEASSIDEWEAQSPVRMEQTDVLLEKKLLIGKVAACLELVATGQHGERDRRIFWLYYRVGLSASAIAALPAIGLSTKGVETTLLRLTRAIRHQLTGRKNEDARSSKLLEGISPENSL